MTANASVTIEVGGKLYSGTYSVAKHFLSVSSGLASKTTIFGTIRPERLARMLLRQIVLKQKKCSRTK